VPGNGAAIIGDGHQAAGGTMLRGRIGLLVLASSAAVVASSMASATAAPMAAKPASAAATIGAPLYAFNSGMALTVSAKPRAGATVRIETYRGSAGQRWVFGKHQTVRPAADLNLCLNVPGGRYRGAELQLGTCDGHGSQRFVTTAPSAHTPVLFIQPAARARYCLTSLGDVIPDAGERVGLSACASLVTQAWSQTNLDDVAGGIESSWNMQALQPTKAGSAITGASTATFKLDQYWISSYTGGLEQSPVLLHPVTDTAMCAVLAAPEADGAALDVARCHRRGSGQFMTIPLFLNTAYTLSFITTTDGSYCVQAKARGRAAIRAIVLGGCAGNSRDFWSVGTDMFTPTSGQYQELYAGNNSLEFSMRVTGSGGPGSDVALSNDDDLATQVWTDLAPGQSKAVGNPDDSINLRPLSDKSLCLTVPGADYAAGVRLTVQTCDGQADQEFARGLQNAPTDLVAAGDGEFCVAAASGIEAGSAVELQPCAQQDDQTWTAFFSWYGWAGQSLSGTGPVTLPSDGLVLSGVSSTGAQVAVAPVSGTPDWYTSEDWLNVTDATGFEIQSLYDPGLCLDAPATSAGTQLTAAPCTGGSAQTFGYSEASGGKGSLWELTATPRTARMCVAVGSSGGSAGLPLVLQACSASQPDEAWYGPMYQL
jgi:hypothetical protein